jgi:hypothetical protein
MSVLQVARVANWPYIEGRKAYLPSILNGSTTAKCSRCKADVWLSREGLMYKGTDQALVCEVCQPAAPVHATIEEASS